MNTDILIINGSPRKNRNCFKISEEISNKLNQKPHAVQYSIFIS